jgi:YebC/PmpR family DNA-binding regulatory protein
MAGHSQFKNIMYRKGAQDAKRARAFTKLIRELTVAAHAGLPAPAANPRLRAAVIAARTANMPKETIERAIKRGAGGEGGEHYEEVRYEGYGPGGVAVMVDCMTDNRNRTVGEVRHAFSKHGGNLGSDGSVAFMFSKNGVLSYPAGASEDRILEVALDAGAHDVVTNDDGSIDVLTAPEEFGKVKDALEAAGLKPEAAEVTMRAANSTHIDGENAERMMKLLDVLEDLDDVQKVYSNADISDEVLAKLA